MNPEVSRPGLSEQETAADSRTAHLRVAFSLGWDYAFYGQTCFLDDPDIEKGRQAGQARFGTHGTKKPDRYERKWLLLRTNAWRRQRVVSEDVTPEYLRRIDSAYCPILDIELTHGTMSGSDWSIDRVNNDGAYARGNLAVLSAAVNEAKGSLSFDEVLDRALSTQSSDGLTPVQWLKLASLMGAPCHKTGDPVPVIPYSVLGIRDVPLLFCQYLQGALLLEVRAHVVHVFRPLRQNGGLDRVDRVGFEALMKRIRKRESQRPKANEFWLDPVLFSQFAHWYRELSSSSRKYLRHVMDRRVGEGVPTSQKEWCLDTLGFYPGSESFSE